MPGAFAEDILFARLQMAVSLGFHIIFASIGITMPLLMVLAERTGHRHGDTDAMALAKAWSKGTAVFFAIGAVSGTVLAFELGLLFPGFMKHAGAVIGMPFSLEGFAFFTEAIFLGIYLYGWQRLPPRWHMAAGLVVAVSGALSAFFVTIANAWMNAPTGFRVEDGRLVDIDPIAAMASPFVAHEVLHMLAAAYMGTGFAVAAIHAWALIRNPAARFHRTALRLAMWVAVPCALVQPVIGHFAGQQVARWQPMKLAAIEGHFETSRRAPLHLGGVPDYENERLRWALPLPGALSWLAFGDADAEVKGLKAFPKADWPSPTVRYAFQGMLAIGTLLFLVGLFWAWRRERALDSVAFLRLLVACGPLGYLATELGWIVTEVGRQPWTIYGVMRTSDAATPVSGLWLPFLFFTALYVSLGAVVAAVLWRHVRASLAAETPR